MPRPAPRLHGNAVDSTEVIVDYIERSGLDESLMGGEQADQATFSEVDPDDELIFLQDYAVPAAPGHDSGTSSTVLVTAAL